MKNLILCLVILSTGSSFAQDIGQFEGEIRNVLSMVDNMEESISTTPQTTTALDLSDYQQVREAFLQRVSEQSNAFRSCLGEIAETAQFELSRLEQEINDLVAENRRRRSSALADLIRDKREALDSSKEYLERSLGRRYGACIGGFISLGGFISVAYSTHVPRERRRVRLIYLIPFPFTVLGYAANEYDLQYLPRSEVRSWMNGVVGTSSHFRLRGWREVGESYNREQVLRMTEGCRVSACRYMLVNDILNWIEQAIEVNNDLELMDGFVLEERDLPDWNRRFMRRVRRYLNNALSQITVNELE